MVETEMGMRPSQMSRCNLGRREVRCFNSGEIVFSRLMCMLDFEWFLNLLLVCSPSESLLMIFGDLADGSHSCVLDLIHEVLLRSSSCDLWHYSIFTFPVHVGWQPLFRKGLSEAWIHQAFFNLPGGSLFCALCWFCGTDSDKIRFFSLIRLFVFLPEVAPALLLNERREEKHWVAV